MMQLSKGLGIDKFKETLGELSCNIAAMRGDIAKE